MRRTSPFLVACAAILVLVGAVALGARNSSGTYSLPAGNPVVSGTTITSSWANSTLSDLGTEITDSLDRYGRGAMLAPFKSIDGTVGAPGLTFSSEQTSGLYRAASGDLRLSALDTQVQKWTSAASEISLPLTCDEGVTVTNSTTNGNGVTATGNGTADGVKGTGGSSNGIGVEGVGNGTAQGVKGTGGTSGGPGGYFAGGGGNADGVQGHATGTGYGGNFTGGASGGSGLHALGDGNGNGVEGVGHGTGYGGDFTPGASQSVAIHSQGSIAFTQSNPLPSTGYSNTLTPKNVVKAWAVISVAAGTPTVSDGFNIASVSATSTSIVVTFATALDASNRVAVTASTSTSNDLVASTVIGGSGTTVTFTFWSLTIGSARTISADTFTLNLVAMSAQ